MGGCRGVNTVDGIRCNVHGALETKGHVRPPQVIVNGLGKGDDVQSLRPQKISRLMRPVSAKDHDAVQAQLVIVLLHGIHLVDAVLIRILNGLKRRPGAAKDRASLCQNTGKVAAVQHTEISVDEPLVTVYEPIDFHLLLAVYKAFHNASHGSVERLAVTAAC